MPDSIEAVDICNKILQIARRSSRRIEWLGFTARAAGAIAFYQVNLTTLYVGTNPFEEEIIRACNFQQWSMLMGRRIAVALPALNEEERMVACVSALLDQLNNIQPPSFYSIHVLANNCADRTAEVLRRGFPGQKGLYINEVTLLPEFANAGWARRFAMEEGAQILRFDDDLILSTDADTIVAKDWLSRSLSYFDQGFDAVAGFAFVHPIEWRNLSAEKYNRLCLLRRYRTILSYLRARNSDGADCWPRHDYEGGASIALTLRMYREIGGCPPLPVGEDKALFEAVRRAGGKIRHALDVKVSTSGRFNGRAPGGMADTINAWCHQSSSHPLHDVWPLNVELGYMAQSKSRPLTFEDLPKEIETAQALVRKLRSSQQLALSA